MAHQDQGSEGTPGCNAHDLQQALQWMLTGVVFRGIAFRSDCSWTPMSLVFAGLLWAWSDEKTLKERFTTSRKIIRFLLGEQAELATSYQAFIKLLRKWTVPLLQTLQTAFRQRMRHGLATVWRVAGWLVFAVDGSKVDVPRTRKNEACYSPQSKLARAAGKRRRRGRARQDARARQANVPRIWMTVLWHVGSGLPWNWCTGPSDSSERAHLEQMLPSLPPGSLLTADAGFVGYEFWNQIRAAGHQLLVRVGGNVTLLKKLGYARERHGLVYLWPERAARRRLAPMLLRLVVVRTGRSPVYLVSSILAQSQLSDQQVAAVYRRRWGIEVYYRSAKQTFERRKLRSHHPDNAMVELHWALLGMWAMGLHATYRLIRQGVPTSRISFANVWRSYRRPMRQYNGPPDPGERVHDLLDRALIDPYVRKSKASRDYPRKKHEKPPGPPVILKASRAQVQQAHILRTEQRKRLTA